MAKPVPELGSPNLSFDITKPSRLTMDELLDNDEGLRKDILSEIENRFQ